MRVIDTENVRPFDVDKCLVREHKGQSTVLPTAEVYDAVEDKLVKVQINRAMVRLLKEEKHRGGFIIVWSRSGKEWAKNVVEALGLEKYVDQVMSKPVVYFDDTPVQDWLKDRVFLDFDFVYKE